APPEVSFTTPAMPPACCAHAAGVSPNTQMSAPRLKPTTFVRINNSIDATRRNRSGWESGGMGAAYQRHGAASCRSRETSRPAKALRPGHCRGLDRVLGTFRERIYKHRITRPFARKCL